MQRDQSSAPKCAVHAYKWAAVSALPVIGLLAACGQSSTVVPAGVHRSATPTVAPTPAPAATSPSAAPLQPPVVMIAQEDSASSPFVLQAMDPTGTPLWATRSASSSGPVPFTAGPRVFEVDYQAKKVSVYDRSGHPLGSGDGPGKVFSPTSAEWAWSTSDSVSSSPAPAGSPVTTSGSFWVAGIGEAPHQVYHWTEKDAVSSLVGAFDSLTEWSDQGLVSSEPPPWAGCAEGHQSSSFIIDPRTGTRTDIGTDPVVDVHAGVIVSTPRGGPNTSQAIVLSGRTSDTWSDPSPTTENPKGAYISPAGDMVAVPLINVSCAGDQPRFRTALIDVADHSVQYLPNAYVSGWLDDTHLIAQTTFNFSTQNQELDVVGLDGTHSLLGHGRLIGVVSPS